MGLHQLTLGGQRVVVVVQVTPVEVVLGRDAVDVLLDVGVTVARDIAIGIRRIVRIETILLLPLVGHAVLVGIDIGLALILGVAAHLAGIGDDTELVRLVVETAIAERAIGFLRSMQLLPRIKKSGLLSQPRFLYSFRFSI